MAEVLGELENLPAKIGEDSTAIRTNIMAIDDALESYFKQAGINYVESDGDEWLYERDIDSQSWNRLVIEKHLGVWRIMFEWVHTDPDHLEDYENWVDCYGGNRTLSDINRKYFPYIIEKLPILLDGYVEELKHRHAKYAALRDKVEVMAKIFK